MKWAFFTSSFQIKCYASRMSHAGGKHGKDRVTVLVAANADGSEKLPLLVIGKNKSHDALKMPTHCLLCMMHQTKPG